MKTQEFKISGMTCQHCVKAVEIELEELGIDKYEVDIGTAKVNFDEKKFSVQSIKDAIKEAGYEVID